MVALVRSVRGAPSVDCVPGQLRPLLSLTALALVLAGCGTADVRKIAGDGASGAGATTARVLRLTDGDTFRALVDGRSQPVRIIGIDTPERGDEPCASLATASLGRRIMGRRVRLVWDAERRDRYDRLLAYVEAGGRDVGLALLREGLAEPLRVPPNTARARAYRRASEAAGGPRRSCGG